MEFKMKLKDTQNLLKALFISFLMLFFSMPTFADDDVEGEITEGMEYWFGLPMCGRSSDEPVRWGTYPVELWVSSKVNTQVLIESADGTLPAIWYPITANQIRIFSLTEQLENRNSEEVNPFGIHIIGKDPISVGVFVAYKWSGEAYRVTPVEWLGTEYFTLNMYQEEVRMHDGKSQFKPAEFLIVATDDQTVVQYTPKFDTEKIKKGQTGTAYLNKGDCFLVKAKTYPNLNQQWETDLSGSYIKANKPIAVISGHTKSAFPRFSTTMLGMKSDFMRNMLMEMMWPIELLGKEYVSAPILYKNRTYTTANAVPEMEGDIIRFIATEDNTEIYQMRQDGSGLMKISPKLKKGDRYDITVQKVAAYYKANKPVLVGQYGKAWWLSAVSPTNEKTDQPQNPPRNGQGMLMTLTPIEQWCSYATFRSVPGMDNFFYVTFRSKDLDLLKFDGKLFTVYFGASVKEIAGTEYSYIVSEIPQGDHRIEGLKGAKFAAYAYGNWDAGKDGFAYGYPVGINYAQKCLDTLIVKDTVICGNVEGNAVVTDLNPDTSCAAIFSVLFRSADSYNYNFELINFKSGNKTANYKLTVIDLKQPAKGIVTVLTKSGKRVTRTYEYYPEEVSANPTFLNFGLLQLNEEKCLKFTLKNVGTVPATVKNLRLKSSRPEFEIKTKDLPVTLQPNESKEITVCATAKELSKYAVKDSVIVELSCFEETKVGLEFTTGDPIVWIGDASWGEVPVGQERSKKVEIINQGTVDVVIYTIDWPDKLHFTRVEDLPLPLTLKSSEGQNRHVFTVYYKPDVPGVPHSTRALFTSNATKVKLYSDWDGIGIQAGPEIIGYDWMKRRVVDDFVPDSIKQNGYHGTVILNNTGNTKLIVQDVVIENDLEGVFRLERKQIPGDLQPNNPIPIDVYFSPKSEKTYSAKVTLITTFNNEEKKATASLDGIGIQPHINVIGKNFGPAILIGQSKDDYGIVEHITNINPMALTVFKLSIEGTDKDAFEILPDFFANNPYPIVIPINGTLQVPIRFTAKHPGPHYANLVAESDAPITDNHVGELIGRGYNEGLEAIDYNYPTIFITTSADGQVYLKNVGSGPVTITRDILASLDGADKNDFVIYDWHTSGGLQKPTVPFELQPDEYLYVDVRFTPRRIGYHSAYITYLTSGGTEVSNLTGEGMILKMIAKIPKGYIVKPGQSVTVQYRIDKHPEELKQLEQAGIKSFKAVVYYPSVSSNVAQDVHPDVTVPSDINRNGTMTQDWVIEQLDVTVDYMLVEMRSPNNQPLSGDGVLFEFNMKAFLSDIDKVPLRCDFKPLDNSTNWVVVDTIPGDILIEPVCVNTLRLIQISGFEYSLSQNKPNPAEGKTKIEYSIGLEGWTNLTLYNSTGDKVLEMVNQNLKPGQYELSLNIEALGLPSGVYYYKLKSGPFSDTKPLVITK